VGLVFAVFGTLDYAPVFAEAPRYARAVVESSRARAGRSSRHLHLPLHRRHGQERAVPAARVAARLDGGPDPISALIHAATMVTAGHLHGGAHVAALRALRGRQSFVIVIGAITMFFMALIALVQYDIKRVVAYSTLSQLGYMTWRSAPAPTRRASSTS
jgi:NADH-quinone oxidoreductase subunit L